MKQRYTEFIVLLTSDKRKAAVLSALVVLAGALWIKMMLTQDPASANASTPGSAGTGSSDLASNPTLSESGGFEVAPLVVLPRTEPLTRDLFEPGPVFVRQPLQTEQADASGPKSAQGFDDNSPVSPELRRLELERVVREESSRLHLSSTMIGSNPVAVIQVDGSNGTRKVLSVGDIVLGFELVEVSARSAVLSKNGIRVEMNIGQR
jgi:hypothetical protein